MLNITKEEITSYIEFKKKINEIKGANKGPLKVGCREVGLSTSGNKEFLQARLMLAAAFAYGKAGFMTQNHILIRYRLKVRGVDVDVMFVFCEED